MVYKSWALNFLSGVDSNLVIYCNDEAKEFLARISSHSKTVIIFNTFFQSPFEFDCLIDHRSDYQTVQFDRDPEKTSHSSDLYAIWNSKSCLMKQVVNYNPFNSSFFLWVDIGSLRTPKKLSGWP